MMDYVVKNIRGVTAVLNEQSVREPKMIRFIDSNYHKLFSIPDGASIRICYADDDPRRTKNFVCRYIDDYHLTVGSSVFHIAEFAERMESIKATYAPAPEKHIIWSNIAPDFEAWKKETQHNMPDLSDSQLYNRMMEDINERLTDERVNLKNGKYDILAIGDIGLWNKRVTGYKEYLNSPISAVLSTDSEYSEWYVDENAELCSTQHHHDGVNYILYRKYKENTTEDQRRQLKELIFDGKEFVGALKRYTESLGLDVAKVYGWNLDYTEKMPEKGEAR